MKNIIKTKGPVTTAIHTHPKMKFYHKGVFHPSPCSKTDLDHAVIAVGYGRLNGLDYFIIRNRF